MCSTGRARSRSQAAQIMTPSARAGNSRAGTNVAFGIWRGSSGGGERGIYRNRPLRFEGRRAGAQLHDRSTLKRRLAKIRSALRFESFADAGAFGAKLSQDRECAVERCVAPLFLERTGK